MAGAVLGTENRIVRPHDAEGAIEFNAVRRKRLTMQQKVGRKTPWLKVIKETVIWLGVGFALGSGLLTFGIQILHVPSKSMVDTLVVGDRLVVSKWTYGYSRHSLPRPLYQLLSFLPDWQLFARAPQRGDVVVFRLPSDPSNYYVKRVVGLPGDEITLEADQLVINGQKLGYRKLTDDYFSWQETASNGKSYMVRKLPGYRDYAGPFRVPAGEYFVMGDNRPFSKDSRSPEVATIPAPYLVGRVDVILYSLRNNVRGPLYFWDWSGFTSSRVFKRVR